MRTLNTKGIISQTEKRGTAPAKLGRGALQDGLRDGDAGRDFVFTLALERRGRDPQQERWLGPAQPGPAAGRGGEGASGQRRLAEPRTGFSCFWFAVFVRMFFRHFGQRQRVHPPPPSLHTVWYGARSH